MARTDDYETLDYMDDFGEVIESDDDMATEEMIPDEADTDTIDDSDETIEERKSNGFYETLNSDEVSDQLDDDALKTEAEVAYSDADGVDDEDRVKPASDDDLAA